MVDPLIVTSTPAASSRGAAKQSRRLLIVEDDQDFADSLVDILSSEGYELEVAHNCDQALAKLRSSDAKTALIDIRLGSENGVALIAKLKAIRPKLVCVLMTAYASIDTAVEGLRQGVYDYLRKPIYPEELMLMLERIQDRIELERSKDAAELALKRSCADYKNLVEGSIQGIRIEVAGAVVFANQAYANILGYASPSEIIGQSIGSFVAPEDQQRMAEYGRNRYAGKSAPARYEYHGLAQDGRVIRLLNLERTIVWGSQPAIQSATIDVTEQRQAEAELQQYRDHLVDMVAQKTAALETANKELESFSYSVSHDLRAPLRSINGFSHMLLEDYRQGLDETAQDYLQRINRASERMGELIDDLLTLSRLSRRDMAFEKVDLSQLAQRILAEFKREQPQRNVETEVSGSLLARGDPHLINVVLENLLNNAWKYTSKEAIAEIKFSSTQENGRSVFMVQDNGVGFDMQYTDKLFEPFQRLHSMDEFEGNGIGLATVRRVVRKHGGNIWAEATLGEGATFYFTLEE